MVHEDWRCRHFGMKVCIRHEGKDVVLLVLWRSTRIQVISPLWPPIPEPRGHMYVVVHDLL